MRKSIFGELPTVRDLLRGWGALSFLTALPFSASAASIISGEIEGCDFATGKITAECIPNFIAHVIGFLFMGSGAICLLVIIYSGFEMVIGAAAGKDKSAPQQRITWALGGFIISALSWFIIDFVISSLAGI